MLRGRGTGSLSEAQGNYRDHLKRAMKSDK